VSAAHARRELGGRTLPPPPARSPSAAGCGALCCLRLAIDDCLPPARRELASAPRPALAMLRNRRQRQPRRKRREPKAGLLAEVTSFYLERGRGWGRRCRARLPSALLPQDRFTSRRGIADRPPARPPRARTTRRPGAGAPSKPGRFPARQSELPKPCIFMRGVLH
jgi:hypothetical protein